MTESEKWAALRETNLSQHEPFCNYGHSNGREMCTCQVLVDIVEGNTDEPETVPLGDVVRRSTDRSTAGSRSEQRARRLAQQRAAKGRAK